MNNTDTLKGAPLTRDEFRNELLNMLYDDLRRAADTSLSAMSRFNSLLNTAENVDMFKRQYGAAGLPENLRDPEYLKSQMRGLGQRALVEMARDLNGNQEPPGANGWLQRRALLEGVQKIIKEMAERGLQSEEQSYAMYGGKAAFEEKLALARSREAPRTKMAMGSDLTQDQAYITSPDPSSGISSNPVLGMAGDMAAIYSAVRPASAPTATSAPVSALVEPLVAKTTAPLAATPFKPVLG